MSEQTTGERSLTPDQKREFKRNGLVVIEDAVEEELCERAREAFWEAIHVDRDDPCSWVGESRDGTELARLPTVEPFEQLLREVYPYAEDLVGPGLGAPDDPPVASPPGEPPLQHRAHGQIGYVEGVEHEGVLGPYPNYPEEGTVHEWDPAPGIHLDGDDNRAEIEGNRYLPFVVFLGVYVNRVAPRGGGFTAWPGSHEIMGEHFRDGGDYHDLPGDLVEEFGLGYPFEVTGGPGTAFIAHPAIAHAASPNLSDRVRMLCLGRLGHVDQEYDSQEVIRDIWEYFNGVPG